MAFRGREMMKKLAKKVGGESNLAPGVKEKTHPVRQPHQRRRRQQVKKVLEAKCPGQASLQLHTRPPH
ncbi:hypothetical protein QYF36_009099 [Acer negundo]|nr:hypothetical protein QYF36_009099 [Acer negundo]